MSYGDNGKMLTVSRKLVKILTVSRKSHHRIKTLLLTFVSAYFFHPSMSSQYQTHSVGKLLPRSLM